MAENVINIYTTETCIWCKRAKEYFKEKGIKYNEFKVDSDQEKLKEMVEKSGQMGVPVIEVNGKIIVGFNQGEIEANLN